jgi:hypothetical protein
MTEETMMKRVLFGMMAFAAVAMFLASQAASQPPDGKEDKGGPKGPPRYELGQIFPPPLLEELKMTADQEKELDAIKVELKTKLEKLLTPEQKKKIESFRLRGPTGPGGPDGKGALSPRPAEKSGDRPEQPPVDKKGEKPPDDKKGAKPPVE